MTNPTTRTPERPPPAPDLYAEAEIRRAARALMQRPLLAEDAGRTDDLAMVRRHRAELTRLFAEGLGYRLIVEPGFARLVKYGLGADSTRGLRRRNGSPFTPRRYALLTLTLAALARSRPQLMIDELVAEVRSAAADAGVDVDLDAITDRRALHSALLALTDLGILSERDGDLEHWAERRTESLLDVHRDRLAVLVAAPLGGCDGPDDVLAVVAVPSRAGGARVAVRRRLAEQPVLSTDELTDEQQEWWRRNRNRERDWFRRFLGLELELRAEGAVAIDPDDAMTDRGFPGSGSARHFALLLLEQLVQIARDTESRGSGSRGSGSRGSDGHGSDGHGSDGHGSDGEGSDGEGSATTWARVPASTARQAADGVFDTWRPGFRKAHREDPSALYAEALDVLVESGLLRRDVGGVLLHAAAARYAPEPTLVAAGAGQRSLFDEDQP